MTDNLKSLRHGKEKLYGTLVTIAGALIWCGVILLIVKAFARGIPKDLIVVGVEFVIFLIVVTLIKNFYRAHLFGHAVLLGPDQFPHLYQSVAAGAQKLGLREAPHAFLYNSNGLMNAFAMRVFSNRFVLLTSALVDVESDAQIDFIIGHELGHHAAGHLSFWKNALKLPGTFIPFLGTAYHRARELTADRYGAYCTGDRDASRGALHMLACGSARLNGAMNANAFAAQEHLVPPLSGFLLHVFSGYPRLTRRVKEIDAFFASARAGGQERRAPAF